MAAAGVAEGACQGSRAAAPSRGAAASHVAASEASEACLASARILPVGVAALDGSPCPVGAPAEEPAAAGQAVGLEVAVARGCLTTPSADEIAKGRTSGLPPGSLPNTR